MSAQERIDTLLQDLVSGGREVGLQVAAYIEEELVIDSWAGLAGPEEGREVDGDTLFHVFSAGKGVTATAVHVLADRGALGYEDPISEHWPEFAANGKERITVRHALTHSAGIPYLPEATTLRDLCDWDQMCATVADLSPIWEPGTKSGYHGLTFGWLLGEVVRRASGRRIDQIVREDIAGPLGVADSLALGITEAMRRRMAVHHDDGVGPSTAPLNIPLVTYPFPYSTGANDPLFLTSCVPAGATASARALARMYAALANGGELGGATLMSPTRVAATAAVAVDGVDEVLGRPIRRGLGYVLGEPGTPMGTDGSFGHGGTGESIGFADPQRRFAFALTKSNLTQPRPNSTVTTVADEVRTALGLTPSGTRRTVAAERFTQSPGTDTPAGGSPPRCAGHRCPRPTQADDGRACPPSGTERHQSARAGIRDDAARAEDVPRVKGRPARACTSSPPVGAPLTARTTAAAAGWWAGV